MCVCVRVCGGTASCGTCVQCSVVFVRGKKMKVRVWMTHYRDSQCSAYASRLIGTYERYELQGKYIVTFLNPEDFKNNTMLEPFESCRINFGKQRTDGDLSRLAALGMKLLLSLVIRQ